MFATTESSGLGLSFIAGGMDWIRGMLTLNAWDPNKLSPANSTNNVPCFWGLATEYVRFRYKGVLVSVGGYTKLSNIQQRDMSTVQIYEIDSQQWFQVTAACDIARTRSSFCSGLAFLAAMFGSRRTTQTPRQGLWKMRKWEIIALKYQIAPAEHGNTGNAIISSCGIQRADVDLWSHRDRENSIRTFLFWQ